MKAARMVFWVIFLVGVIGFSVTLWRFTELRDEIILEWNAPGETLVDLEAGQYRMWLMQDPPGEEFDQSFQEYWFQGWRIAGFAMEGGEETTRRVSLGPLNGVSQWHDNPRRPVSVAMLTLPEAGRVVIRASRGNDTIEPAPARLALAASSLDQQNQMTIAMMAWLMGGILLGVLGFAAVAGLGKEEKG